MMEKEFIVSRPIITIYDPALIEGYFPTPAVQQMVRATVCLHRRIAQLSVGRDALLFWQPLLNRLGRAEP